MALTFQGVLESFFSDQSDTFLCISGSEAQGTGWSSSRVSLWRIEVGGLACLALARVGLQGLGSGARGSLLSDPRGPKTSAEQQFQIGSCLVSSLKNEAPFLLLGLRRAGRVVDYPCRHQPWLPLERVALGTDGNSHPRPCGASGDLGACSSPPNQNKRKKKMKLPACDPAFSLGEQNWSWGL